MTFQLVQKQNVLMRHLRNWGNLSHRRMGRKMAEIHGHLENIQRSIAGDCGLDQQGGNTVGLHGLHDLMWEDRKLREDLDKLMDVGEVFWVQRAKQRWLELGNSNSRKGGEDELMKSTSCPCFANSQLSNLETLHPILQQRT